MNSKNTLPPRYEAFAQSIVLGKSAAESYRLAGYSVRGANKRANRLMANDGIQSRIAELRQIAERQNAFTRNQYIGELVETFKSMPPEHSNWPRVAYLLAKAMGWNEPEKINLSQNMEVVVTIGGERVE